MCRRYQGIHVAKIFKPVIFWHTSSLLPTKQNSDVLQWPINDTHLWSSSQVILW
jgi:hypothetical protein